VCTVGQIRIYTPYMTVDLAISLPKIPHTHRIYMVLANPSCLWYTTFGGIVAPYSSNLPFFLLCLGTYQPCCSRQTAWSCDRTWGRAQRSR